MRRVSLNGIEAVMPSFMPLCFTQDLNEKNAHFSVPCNGHRMSKPNKKYIDFPMFSEATN